MKVMYIVAGLILGTLLLQAGPQINLRDDVKVAERIADDQWKTGTNYVSDAQFIADLEAATKLDDLKAALLRKAKSDKDKVDKQNTEKVKVTK